MIPMVDLKEQYQSLKRDIDQGIEEVLAGCHFILGPNVQAFEAEAAEYLGVKHAVTCASGTDALHLALLANGIGPGDEVITPAFTFIATAEAIRYVGATPKFADIKPDTFNVDPSSVESLITEKTKAILPVHLFGQPADIAAIKQLCDERDLLLIEDCAQSFGAAIGGKMTGTFGEAGCFSFFPSKNLGCYGDGGMVTTNSDEIADTLKVYRNHGSRERYYHEVIGYNSRLDEIQAVVLRTKLRHIDEFNRARYQAAQQYSTALASTSATPPHEDKIGRHVYHQYTTLMPNREQVMEHLMQQGVSCAIYYPVPLHQQQAFADTDQARLPVTEDVVSRCLSLPIFPEIKSEQIQQAVAAIEEALNS